MQQHYSSISIYRLASWMRQAAPSLESVSPERVRDELFRIFGGRRPDLAIRALDLLGVLPVVLPELPALRVCFSPRLMSTMYGTIP